VNSTGTNKTTVLEELENQKDANQKCFGSTSQSYHLALPWIIHSSKQGKTRTRQGGNPFRRLIQANSVYIFWYQEAVIRNYDVETFVLAMMAGPAHGQELGVGAPRPARLGTWTSFSSINGCKLICKLSI